MNEGYTATTDFEQISIALQSFWKPFNELFNEMTSFVPRPLSDFDFERNQLFEDIRKMNPDASDEQVDEWAAMQIASRGAAGWQFYGRFADRIMTMYVTVTLLSQALCEAEINAILAIGLHEKGLVDQFAKIERADIRKKWLEHPKLFCPTYELKKNSELYITLNHLIENRNAWMHHKIGLSVGEEKILEGSLRERDTYQEKMRWLKRYFSLPYDLAAHAHEYTHQAIVAMMFFTRNPIPIADAHK